MLRATTASLLQQNANPRFSRSEVKIEQVKKNSHLSENNGNGFTTYENLHTAKEYNTQSFNFQNVNKKS